ncbi:DUF3352 domain-containing protein [Calothrix sp. 336/3]|uniref:DUF3352 domain-containing protein n=1 Tax=Calothrix sp. 336/3 TaxID=1337936 RepID=UPI0004E4673A|nr:DUF3352 domain-containing protein [Calothrix sp. 336/3]AKG24156.1 hypothetical protein IJ00_25080 [Calothrix sp. 336/3]
MKQNLLLHLVKVSFCVFLITCLNGCSNALSSASLKVLGNAGTGRQPEAAIFVSKQAPVMASLLVDGKKLSNLVKDTELAKIKSSIFGNISLDYNQDIRPWLGNEITLAVTTPDIDGDGKNGKQPGYLVALATKKPEKSREFVDLLFSKRTLAGTNLTTEEYEGIKILYDFPQVAIKEKLTNTQPPIQNHLAGAAIGDDFILLANDHRVLREAINNVQAPDTNLTSSSKYQKVIQELPKGGLGVAFLNLPMVANWQGLKLSTPTYNQELISLAIPGKGVLAETTLLAAGESLPNLAPLEKPVGALQYIPSFASMVFAGKDLSNLTNSNLAQFGQQIATVVSGNSSEAGLFKPLREWEKSLGINLSQDIFPWVKGEYALGLFTHGIKNSPDWILVAEKSPETAESVSHLDEIAKEKGLSLNTIALGKQEVSTWTKLTAEKKTNSSKGYNLSAQVYGIHTSQGNYDILASSLDVIDAVINPQEKSLLDNRNFQNSVAAIPQINQGYAYLDWQDSRDILESQIPILKLVEVLEKPFFQNLRSLTISSYGNQANTLKGGIFLQLDGL